MVKEKQISCIFIRHGKTKSNEEGRYLGWTDASLSELGIEEIKAANKDKAYFIDQLFTSPMKRCIETAKLIFPDNEPMFIENWKEMNFGDFENMNYQELDGNPDYQAYIDSGGEIAFPGGESKAEFTLRCKKGFYEFADICVENDIKSAAAVVHGGTIMAVLSSIVGGEYFSYQVKCGKGYKLTFTYADESIDVISCEPI